jgi:hypothetical protein
VRRENKNQKFHGQVQTALNESELFRQPVKLISDHYLTKIILGITALVAGLLFFPFAIRSIIAEASVLVLMIWISSKLIKSQKGATFWRFWVVVLTMLLFAAACPFIVFPKPLYFALLESANPSKANVHTLDSGGKVIGSTLLVSDLDYIRQGIASILRQVFPENFRVLEKTELGNGSYYSLPVFKGFIFNSSEPGEIPAPKTIYFPVDAPNYTIELDLIKLDILSSKIEPQESNFSFNSGVDLVPFIDLAYDQYPETIPWECVQVQQGQESQVLSYAALLDRSLEFFAVGKTEDGLNGLETDANFVPAQNLEGARLAVLKMAFVQLSLSGNIGELQSLPFLHKAYDLFLHSRGDPRFSEKDPLTNWLRRMLRGSYTDLSWSPVFLDRVAVLNGIPHIEDDRKPYTDFLQNELAGKSYDELLKILQTKNHSSAELHFIRYFVFGKFIQECLGNVLLMETNQDKHVKITQFAEEAKRVNSIIRFLDVSLARKGELQTSPEAGQFVDFVANKLPEIAEETNDDGIEKFLTREAKSNSMLESFTNIFFMAMSKQQTNTFREPMNSQWWKVEYLTWFAGWSLNAAQEINQHGYLWKVSEPPIFSKLNVRKLVSKYGSDYLTKDMGGHGRTFLPGIFILAWYSQTFDLNGAEKFKQQFEAEAQMPFDVYLSKLFGAGDTDLLIPSH